MKKILCILFAALFLCSCAETQHSVDDRVKVVTTIFPVYDFVRAVGGDKVDIKLLIKPGTEVHSYDPVPSDIMAIYNSDLFIYIGGESDKWVDKMLSGYSVNSCAMMDYTDNLTEDGEDEYDEHIWTSPYNAIKMTEKIAERLSEVDPENSKLYKLNADEYADKITEVSEEIGEVVSKSKEPFILVADRFPFKYFASCYKIEYGAASGGCAVSSDISLKVMKRLINEVENRSLKYAFYTEMSNKSVANALKEQTGVKLLELNSAHNVTLSEFNSGITYVDIMKNNLKALKEALL